MSNLIRRQDAIDLIEQFYAFESKGEQIALQIAMRDLPSAQPEIIRCRNCKFASGDSRICMKFGHSPIGELDFCSFAERREVTT